MKRESNYRVVAGMARNGGTFTANCFSVVFPSPLSSFLSPPPSTRVLVKARTGEGKSNTRDKNSWREKDGREGGKLALAETTIMGNKIEVNALLDDTCR